MKNKLILVAILFVLLCLPVQGPAQPGVLIESPVFTFDPVPEGVHISHEFRIKNLGDTLLTITSVRPP